MAALDSRLQACFSEARAAAEARAAVFEAGLLERLPLMHPSTMSDAFKNAREAAEARMERFDAAVAALYADGVPRAIR